MTISRTAGGGYEFFRLLACAAVVVTLIFTWRYAEKIAAGEQEFAPDFRVFYHAAQFGDTDLPLYLDDSQKAALSAGVVPRIDYPYVYPPYSVFFFKPLGMFSYDAAKRVFLMFQLVLWVLVLRSSAVRSLLPSFGQRTDYTLFVCALSAPFVANTLLTGQLGIFLAAITLLGLALMDKAPIRTGVILSLLAVKPTMAIALPVYLIAGRRWKTLSIFALCVLIYATASLTLGGVRLWLDWLESSAFLASVFAMPELPDNFLSQMIGIYTAVRMLGGGIGLAMAIQVFAAFCALSLLIAATLKNVDENRIFSLLLISPLIMNAYVWQYDAVVVAIAIMLLLERGFKTPLSLPARLVMIVALFSPLTALQLQPLGIPYGAMVVVGLWLVIGSHMPECLPLAAKHDIEREN